MPVPKIDGADLISDAQKKLGVTRVKDLAEAMELSASYLHQVGGGHVPLSKKLKERLMAVIDGSFVPAGNGNTDGQYAATLKTKIQEHFDAFLESCNDDPVKLSWWLVEFQRQFPLSAWRAEGNYPEAEEKIVPEPSPAKSQDQLEEDLERAAIAESFEPVRQLKKDKAWKKTAPK